jgi:hypothetical protein
MPLSKSQQGLGPAVAGAGTPGPGPLLHWQAAYFRSPFPPHLVLSHCSHYIKTSCAVIQAKSGGIGSF